MCIQYTFIHICTTCIMSKLQDNELQSDQGWGASVKSMMGSLRLLEKQILGNEGENAKIRTRQEVSF